MNEITKFIAGLNQTQKKLFAVAVIAVVAALFDRLLIGPTISRLTALQEDIAKEESSIHQDLRLLSYKDRILQESDEIAPYLTPRILTDDEMISSFLRKLETLAGQTKVVLAKVNPSPGEQEADYWQYHADLECTGQLADVIAFMHAINSDTDLMKVVQFAFNGKKSDTDEIKAAMKIEKIVVTPKPMPPKSNANASPTPAASP